MEPEEEEFETQELIGIYTELWHRLTDAIHHLDWTFSQGVAETEKLRIQYGGLLVRRNEVGAEIALLRTQGGLSHVN